MSAKKCISRTESSMTRRANIDQPREGSSNCEHVKLRQQTSARVDHLQAALQTAPDILRTAAVDEFVESKKIKKIMHIVRVVVENIRSHKMCVKAAAPSKIARLNYSRLANDRMCIRSFSRFSFEHTFYI